MKLNKYSPFVIFISFISILVFCITKYDNKPAYKSPYNLSFDISNLRSVINGSRLTHQNERYVLHVFSSWCTVCTQNHHELLKLKSIDKIKIIGLIWQDSKENIEKMLQKSGNPYYDLIMAGEETIVNLGITGIPETFIIDENNRIILKISGTLTEGELRNAFYTADN